MWLQKHDLTPAGVCFRSPRWPEAGGRKLSLHHQRQSFRNMLLFMCVCVNVFQSCVCCIWLPCAYGWIEQMFWTTWFSLLASTKRTWQNTDTHLFNFFSHSLSLYLFLLQTFPGVKGERSASHEKLPHPRHRRRVLCRGRGEQQEAVQEACRSVHPAGLEEAPLHTDCGETQDALQETHQDYPQGAAGRGWMGSGVMMGVHKALLV